MIESDSHVSTFGTDASTDRNKSGFAEESYGKIDKKAGNIAEKARSEGNRFLREKKVLAADNLKGLADALRMTAGNLEENDYGPIAGWAEQAAGKLASWADNIREHDIDQLSRQAGEALKRNKGLVVGGAFLVGFAISRFLKSSSGR
jgi:uncharacterized protein YjbJ (UPF0337 family)